MESFEFILYPIIWIMMQVLEGLYRMVQSYGLAIILLSLLMTIASYPLLRFGYKLEAYYRTLTAQMEPEIVEVKKNYTGERRFSEIDKIYQKYNYHPIKSIYLAGGFLFQLPILLSSMLLLLDYAPLQGQQFLFVNDLSKEDGYFSFLKITINALPIILLLMTILICYINAKMIKSEKIRYIFIMLFIVVLIYPLPSGVIIYWIFNNMWSMALANWTQK